MGQSAAKPSAESFFASQAEGWDARYASRTYRERRKLIRGIVVAEVARFSRPSSEIEVLDFGCGGGVLLEDFLELGLRVTGVDTSREMIAQARLYLGRGAQQVDLECLTSGSGEGSYQNRDYDIVLCTSVLEFVPELEEVVERLAAVLRSGGILIVSVPNRQSCLRGVEQFMHRHAGMFRHLPVLSRFAQKGACLDIQEHQFTLAELTRQFARTGLYCESSRFHVAPRFMRGFENSPTIGMMLTAVFRK